jgi:hypothetical protein
VSLTPRIRDFLVSLDDLVAARDWPDLDRDAMRANPGDAAVLVHLRHRQDHARDVEVEVDDHRVVVRYPPEHISFTSRDEALRFIEMLGDGRIELELQRGLWTTMRSYRDGLALPFRRTRMPWPTLHPRTERVQFGFEGDETNVQ